MLNLKALNLNSHRVEKWFAKGTRRMMRLVNFVTVLAMLFSQAIPATAALAAPAAPQTVAAANAAALGSALSPAWLRVDPQAAAPQAAAVNSASQAAALGSALSPAWLGALPQAVAPQAAAPQGVANSAPQAAAAINAPALGSALSPAWLAASSKAAAPLAAPDGGQAAGLKARPMAAGVCPPAANVFINLTIPAYSVSRGNAAGDLYTVVMRNDSAVAIPEVGLLVDPNVGFYYLAGSASAISSDSGTLSLSAPGGNTAPNAAFSITPLGVPTPPQKTLAPGEIITFTFRLATDADAASSQMLVASLQSGSPSPLLCKSAVQNVPTVRGNLVVEKSPTTQDGTYGDVKTWQVTLKNTGLGTVYGAQFSDFAGAGYIGLNIDPPVSPQELIPNQSKIYTVTAQINACTNLTNTVGAWWSIGNLDGTATPANPLVDEVDILYLLTEPAVKVEMGALPSQSYCGALSADIPVTVTSMGPGPARGVALLADLQGVSISTSDPNWSQSGNTFTYLAGSPAGALLAGQQVVFMLRVTSPNLCSSQVLSVNLTPQFHDACQLQDYSGVSGASSAAAAAEAPSLSISKSGPPATVLAGDVFTYYVSVSGNNQQEIVAPGVVITDLIPANLQILTVSASSGPVVQAGQMVTWTLPATNIPGAYAETLSIQVRVPYRGEQSCAAPIDFTNRASSVAQGCPTCPPLRAADTLTTRLNDYQPGQDVSISRITPPVELCAPPTTFSNLITASSGITWANAIFSDTLGLGGFSQPLHVVNGSVKVLVDNVDRTSDAVINLGAPLTIDLSAMGTYSATAQISITYQVTAAVGTLPYNTASAASYYAAQFRMGSSNLSVCPGGDLSYTGSEVRLLQGVLDFSVVPGDVLACRTNQVLLTVTGMNGQTLTNNMVVRFTADPSDVFTPTQFTLGGSFTGLTPVVLQVGNVVTYTFPPNQDYNGPGTISLPLFRPCGVETPLQANVIYQDRCKLVRNESGVGGSTTLVSKVSLFVTPNKYTVNNRDTVWRFYVGNYSGVTAEDVVVTNTLPLGHKLNYYTVSSASAPTNTVAMITGTLPSGQEVITFTISSLPAYGRLRFDVHGKIGSLCNLPSRLTIALLDECGLVGDGGGVCQGREDAYVDLLPGVAFLVTSNDQSAHLPLCETGFVKLVVKNSSASADEFNFNITDVLTNVTVTGPVTATVVDEQGNVVIGETTGLPLLGVPFNPVVVTSGNKQTLTWTFSDYASGTAGYDILSRRQAGDVITIYMRVRTGCTGTAAMVKSSVDSLDVCSNPLAGRENAKTLITDAPKLSATKRGYNVTRGYPLTNPVYAYPGDTLRWEVDVTNIGQQHVLNLWVTDTLPANFNYLSSNLGGTHSGGKVTWALSGAPVLNVGATQTFVITGTVTNLVCSDTQNQALAVFGCSAGDVCAGLPANTDFTLQTRPNAFSLTSSGNLSTCGGLITVQIDNNGAPAANVYLTDTLPTGYVFDGLVSATTTPNVLPASGSAQPVFGWSGGNLLPRGITTLVFRVRNSVSAGACAAISLPVSNRVDLAMQDGCSNTYTASNTNSSNFNLTTPNLSVTKTPLTQFRDVGETVTWLVTVRNTGTAEAPNVVVTDVVGSNFGSISATAGSFATSASIVGNQIVWSPPFTLPVGGTWTANVSAQLLSSGQNTNVVTATATCATGCRYAAINTTAYVTLISRFDKGPNTIMAGTIGDIKVFTFTVGLPDIDGIYQNVVLSDTLPVGLGYVGSRLEYQQDQDNPTPPAPVVVTTPSVAPAYLGSGNIRWNLGVLNGVITARGVVTTVILDVPANYGNPVTGNARQVNALRLTYTQDGQPYTYRDTAAADVLEPLAHINKNYNLASLCSSSLLVDNFNDGNSTGWTFSGGTPAISSYTLRMPTTANRRAIAGDASWTDYSFSALALSGGVTNATDNDLGVILRAANVNTYYRLYWRRNLNGSSGAYRLDRVVGGTVTNLVNQAASAYGLNRWQHLEARVQGYTLQFFVNGALAFSYTDASPARLAAGMSGFYTSNQNYAYFDDALASRIGLAGCLVGAGDLVTYTLTISNQQVITAHNLRLVDAIPAGMSLQSFTWNSSDPGAILTAAPAPVPGATGSLVWDFNRLAPRTPFVANQHTTIDLTVVLAVSPAITASLSLNNQAHLTYDSQAGGGPVGVQRQYDGGTHSNGVRTIDPYILKSSSPDQATIGEAVAFTITVPDRAITATLYNITITDNVDPGMLLLTNTVQVSGGVGVVDQTVGNSLRILYSSIPAGTQSFIRYTAVVRNVIGNQEGVIIPNQATLEWDSQPPVTTPPVNTELIEPTLLVSKVVTPTHSVPGGIVFYSLRVYHTPGDTETAYNVTISDVVPSNLSYIPGSLSINSGPLGAINDAGAPLLLAAFPVVAPIWTQANPLRLSYAAVVKDSVAPGTLIPNTAHISYTSTPTDTYGETRDGSGGVDDYFDAASANVSLPEIGVTKSGPITVTAGNLINYLITVRNYGPDATATVVTDTLPFQVSFVSATPSQGSCAHTPNPTGGRIVCNLGVVSPGTVTIQVVGLVDPNTPLAADLTNKVDVVSEAPDGTTTNNHAEVDTEVYTRADVAVNKSGPASAIAGEIVTYTITVGNTGPSTARSVDLKDLLPPGLNYVNAAASQGLCVSGICQLGDLSTGQTVNIVVTATVGADISGTVTNTAQAFSNTADANPANNQDTHPTDITALTRLLINKVDLTDPVYAGETYFYEIVITNTGPSTAQAVVISDTLPVEVSFEGTSPECTHDGSPSGGRLTCALGDLAPGEVRDFLVNVRVLDTVANGTVGLNRMEASTSTPVTPDSVLYDQEPTTYLQKVGNPLDLGLTKSVTPATMVAGGGRFTYRLVATNYGPANASDVIVVDAYPREFSFVSATASNGAVCNEGMTCALHNLAVGESVVITLVVDVPAGTPADSYLNTARITSPAPEINLANNDAQAVSNVTALANLAMGKRAYPNPATPGDNLTYIITVTNLGVSDAANVTVADVLPIGFTPLAISSSQGNCAAFPCNIGTLKPGQVVTLWVVGVVRANATAAQVANTATATSTTPGSGASASTTPGLTGQSDLALTKTGTPTAYPGATATYTLTLRNLGLSDASGVVLTDNLPSGLNFSSITPAVGCSENLGQIVCLVGALAANAEVQYVVQAVVDAGVEPGSSLENRAVVTSSTPDSNPLNNQANADTSILGRADLVVTKTQDTPNPILAGEWVTYTLQVNNLGPGTARQVDVKDQLPAGLTLERISASDGGVCGGAICQFGSLPAGETRTITVTARVDSDAPAGSVVNTAAAYSVDESDPSNNTATITTQITVDADVSVRKVALSDPVGPLDALVYQVLVSNAGPSAARDVIVTDTLSVNVSFMSATPGCVYAGGQVVCSVGDLAAGATSAYLIAVRVGDVPSGTLLTNAALVGAATPDSDPSNNVTSIDTPVEQPQGPSAEVGLQKSGSPASVRAGDVVTYTLTVTNAGPQSATNVRVLELIPAGATALSLTANNPDAGDEHCSLGGACYLGTVYSTTVATIEVVLRVNADYLGNQVVNTASVSADQFDPQPGNNIASETTGVTQLADLALVKADLADPVTAGELILYQLWITNTGPSLAQNVVVTDAIPAGTVYAGASPVCSQSGGVVTCSLGDLAAGATASVWVQVRADAALPDPTTVVNTARVSSATPESNLGDNQDTETTTVHQSALNPTDLGIVKSDSPDPVTAGDLLTYTLSVTNYGPAPATNVQVVDALPAGTSFVSATPSQGACSGGVACLLGDLAVGANAAVVIVVRVDPAQQTALNNLAQVSAANPDSQPANNQDAETTQVTTQADLRLNKNGPLTAVPGGGVSYQIVVENLGLSDAQGVVVSDTLPAVLSSVVVMASQGSCSLAGDLLTCNLGALAAGASATVDVFAQLDSLATAAFVNTAEVASLTPDGDPSNNRDDATTTPAPMADVELQKQATPTAAAGTNILYSLRLFNHGPSLAQNLVVTDTLPAGVSFVSASTGCAFSAPDMVTCSLASLAAGASAAFTVEVRSDANLIPGSSLENRAVVTSSTADSNPENNRDDADTSIIGLADLGIQKLTIPDPVIAGDLITYTIVVTNYGPSLAQAVQVWDFMPAGVALISVEPSQGICSLTVCMLGDLDVGAQAVIVLVGRVNANLSPGTLLRNRAQVTSVTPDPGPHPNTSTVTNTTDRLADLAITKQHTGVMIPGELFTYRLAVTNLGPSLAAVVVVTDTLPLSITFISSSASCVRSQTNPDVVTCSLGNLAVGASTGFDLVVLPDVRLPQGTLVNLAQVSSQTPDPDPTNNNASDPTLLQPSADLRLSKSDAPDPVVAGETLTYTLIAANLGPSLAQQVVVTDTLPLMVSLLSSNMPCAATGSQPQVILCSLPDMQPGDMLSFQVVVNVSEDTPPGSSLHNLAVIGSLTPDAHPENNTGSAVTTVIAQSDLIVEKTCPVGDLTAGEIVTYTIVTTNQGPSTAQDVDLKDFLPVGMTIVDAHTTTGQPCLGGLCQFGDLQPGETVTVVLTALVGSEILPGQVITNQVTGFTDTFDPDPTNNSDSCSNQVVTNARLVIEKHDLVDPVGQGELLIYAINVRNEGPSDAQAVIVTDTLPAQVNYLSSTDHCVEGPTGSLVCTLGKVAAGEQASFLVTVQVPVDVFSGTILYNTATVGSATPLDPTSILTDDEETHVIEPPMAPADLSILKTATPSTVVAGRDTLTYTLLVVNHGPARATDVEVVDSLPAGLTLIDAQASQGFCWNSVQCSLGVIEVNKSATITIHARIDADVPTGTVITNTAMVRASQPDPDPTNNTSSTPVDVITLTDLSILKLDQPDPATPGTIMTYTLTVVNHGPSDAQDVVVTDALPAGLTFVGSSPANTTGPAPLTWNLGALAAGETTQITLWVMIAPDVTDPFTNTAVVGSSTPESNPANNTSTTVTGLDPLADLSIAKDGQPHIALNGSVVTYTLTVHNLGPSDAQNVVVSDWLPGEAEYVSAQPTPAGGPNPLTWALGTLPVNATRQITVVVRVADWAVDNFTNLASVTSSTPDPQPENNEDDETTTITGVADLSIIKEALPNPVLPENEMHYLLTVHNAGPSPALNVIVSDTLPAEVRLLSAEPSADGGPTPLTWNLGTMQVGETRQITLAVFVEAWANGVFTNTARVGSETPDPNPNDNTSDAPVVTGTPTGVTLSYLRLASFAPWQVNLEWATIMQSGGLDFHLYRSAADDFSTAELVKIQPQHGGVTGAQYQTSDSLPSDGVWYYWLVQEDASGRIIFKSQIIVSVYWRFLPVLRKE